MRYAVLSDVHSNLEALTAVLEALATDHIDRYLCLGDVVGYGADPCACMARLESCNALIVGGNHDLACIGKLSLDWFNDAARTALLWTRDQLSFTQLDTLRRLPLVSTEGPLTLVHGTLAHPQRFEYLMDLAAALDNLRICRTLMCLFGHTHLPCFIEYDRLQGRISRILTSPEELTQVGFTDDPERTRYLVNPGSVGQPRDGDSRASVAVIDFEQSSLSIRRIPYDIALAQRKIREATLPEFLAERLSVGR